MAAAVDALQHALISADAQQELAALPVINGIATLVAALASPEVTICRRAAGAICNASACEAALVALVDAGAAAALVRTLIPPPDSPTRVRPNRPGRPRVRVPRPPATTVRTEMPVFTKYSILMSTGAMLYSTQ